MELNQVYQGHCIEITKTIPDRFINTVVTSPPYWGLRDYGIAKSDWPTMSYSPMTGIPEIIIPEWAGCLGLEPNPEMFVGHMVLVFREIWRVLRDDGTLWINFGDTYSKTGLSGMGDPTIGERNLGGMKMPARSIPNGLKPKDLIGIPWRVAFALQADGWYLRMDNIWSKPNCMPESTTDRPTKAHEYFFLLSKKKKYFFDHKSIREPMAASSIVRLNQGIDGQRGSERANGGAKTNGPQQSRTRAKGNARTFRGGGTYTQGQSFQNSTEVQRGSRGNELNESGMRNKRSVWTVATAQMKEAHFATFPEKLIEPCILAGCPVDGIVLDPFFGSGTTGVVALKHNKNFIGIELNPEYIKIAERRLSEIQLELINEL
jgi:DNA modification methylase